jgi:mannosyltransferase
VAQPPTLQPTEAVSVALPENPPAKSRRLPHAALRGRVAARARALPWWAVAIAIVSALLGLSMALRTTAIHAPFWIDEGLSVGIASHDFLDIPGVLRLDGSPPLFYMALHVWMSIFGDGQATTHAMSLGFALAAVPLAFFGAQSLFGRRAAIIAATLAATNPFLTYYAQETRMYSLVSLEALLVAIALTQVFVFRRRGWIPPLWLSLTAVMYTHNWGLFLAVGSVVALAPVWRATAAADRRPLVRDAVLTYGLVGLAYLPWVPTLLSQAAHTGAPWSLTPTLTSVINALTNILGGPTVPLALLLAGGSGLATIVKERGRGARPVAEPRRTAVWVLITLPAAGLATAFLVSQVSPAFTGRYLAVFVGPLILLAAIGLAHAGRLGLVTVAIIFLLWFDPRTYEVDHKSDVRLVAAKIKSDVFPGDLVVSVHPEQTPVLHYYFPAGLRYADSISMSADPLIFDWRDALDRLQQARPTRVLDSYVSSLRPGQTLVLVSPIIRTANWSAPWTRLVRKRSAQWQRAADRNPNLVRIGAQPRFGHRRLPRGVRATLYRRTAQPRDVAAERRARQAAEAPTDALGTVSPG